MISGVRDTALALACVRHDVPAVHGRGIDALPDTVTKIFAGALVRELTTHELSRAFRVAVQGLMKEIRTVDDQLADRLDSVLSGLADEASRPMAK